MGSESKGRRRNSFFVVDRKDKPKRKKPWQSGASSIATKTTSSLGSFMSDFTTDSVLKEEASEKSKQISDMEDSKHSTASNHSDGSRQGPEKGKTNEDSVSHKKKTVAADTERGQSDEESKHTETQTDQSTVNNEQKEVNDTKENREEMSMNEGSVAEHKEEFAGAAFTGTGGAFFNNDKIADEGLEDSASSVPVSELKEDAYTGTGGAFFKNAEITETKDEMSHNEKKDVAYAGTGGAFFMNNKLKETEEKKSASEYAQNAYSGTGGAFFANDKIPMKDKVEKQDSEDSAVSDVKEGHPSEHREDGADPKAEDEKHVQINEDENKSVDIPKDETKSAFIPVILNDPIEGSKIHEYREEDNVAAEGAFFKKRVIFKCFWHKKYFVLLKDGTMVYHKCNGGQYAKGNWNIKETSNYEKLDKLSAWFHPYRFYCDLKDTQLYFGYDSEEERDFWYEKMKAVSRH